MFKSVENVKYINFAALAYAISKDKNAGIILSFAMDRFMRGSGQSVFLSLADMAKDTGIDRGTLRRGRNVLITEGFIKHDEDSLYFLNSRLIRGYDWRAIEDIGYEDRFDGYIPSMEFSYTFPSETKIEARNIDRMNEMSDEDIADAI